MLTMMASGLSSTVVLVRVHTILDSVLLKVMKTGGVGRLGRTKKKKNAMSVELMRWFVPHYLPH